MLPKFHLSLLAPDLNLIKAFYRHKIGAKLAAKSKKDAPTAWMDFNFYGHQLSIHQGTPPALNYCGIIDGIAVPLPHFGVILTYADFDQLAQNLENYDFILPPTMRFKGIAGEQKTMFFKDPAGNALEIKAFTSTDEIFTR